MSSYMAFAVTVDLVILTVRSGELQALVARRAAAPYRGRWALPGGNVREDEDLDTAARREFAEGTGLSDPRIHLEQLRTYGAPSRDPRMRVVTVAHLALAPDLPGPRTGTDAVDTRWEPVADLLKGRRLAFDHEAILRDGLERARSKLEYTSLGTAFCEAEFTVAELRRVYEIVWGVDLDPRNFHRKVTSTPDFLTATGETTTRDGGRPAQLFSSRSSTGLHPALLRPAPASS